MTDPGSGHVDMTCGAGAGVKALHHGCCEAHCAVAPLRSERAPNSITHRDLIVPWL